MNNLPFNKWTLSFYNNQFEDLYEVEMNKHRQTYFRIIEITILISCVLFFIVKVIEGQQIMMMVILAISSVAIFLALIYGDKFASKVRYYYYFMFLTSVGVSLYVASQKNEKQPFLYGYSSATIAIIQFLFSHFKLRIVTILLIPILQLYIFDVLTVQNFGYIVLTFMTQFLILLYSHYNEFMFRLAFSYMTYNYKLKEVAKEYVPYSFITLSHNPRNNQFQLDFQNQSSITNLNVEDNKSLIEMMRRTWVVPKGYKINNLNFNYSQIQIILFNDNQIQICQLYFIIHFQFIFLFSSSQFNFVYTIQLPPSFDLQNVNIQRSADLSMKRIANKKQTLEEYAFYKIKEKISEDDILRREKIEIMECVFYNKVKEKNFIYSIETKTINYGKNYLFFVFKEEKQPQCQSKSEEQIRFLSKIIEHTANSLSVSQQNLYKEILNLQQNSIDNNKIWQIKCINLSIMNNFQNFYFFVNSNQINNCLASCSKINLKNFLINLQQHFSFMSTKLNKEFVYNLNIDDYMINVNSKFLSQIIINIFQQCINQADSNSYLCLNVTNELNMNPLQINILDEKAPQELEFTVKVADDSYERSTKVEYQKLIKFEFTFYSNKQVHLQSKPTLLLNPQTYEDFHFNNNQEFQLSSPVTNFLLKKIGPYAQIQYELNIQCDNGNSRAFIAYPSMMDLIEKNLLYQNKISFYIYKDQRQLTQSFLKYAQQKSFLQP